MRTALASAAEEGPHEDSVSLRDRGGTTRGHSKWQKKKCLNSTQRTHSQISVVSELRTLIISAVFEFVCLLGDFILFYFI